MTSEETIGSSEYRRIPRAPAVRQLAIACVHFVGGHLGPERDDEVGERAVRDRGTHRHAVHLALELGMTTPIAFAAPVDVGMRLIAAARARRRSLCGRSRICWSFVYAWMVVMKPDSMPHASLRTLASGATQFVVQEAFETIRCCSGS